MCHTCQCPPSLTTLSKGAPDLWPSLFKHGASSCTQLLACTAHTPPLCRVDATARMAARMARRRVLARFKHVQPESTKPLATTTRIFVVRTLLRPMKAHNTSQSAVQEIFSLRL